MTTQFTFNVGDRVRKKTGDYTFNGVVVARDWVKNPKTGAVP